MTVAWLEVALTHQALGAVRSPEFTLSPLHLQSCWGHRASLIWESSKPSLCPGNISPLSPQWVVLGSQASMLGTGGTLHPVALLVPPMSLSPCTPAATQGGVKASGQGVTVLWVTVGCCPGHGPHTPRPVNVPTKVKPSNNHTPANLALHSGGKGNWSSSATHTQQGQPR